MLDFVNGGHLFFQLYNQGMFGTSNFKASHLLQVLLVLFMYIFMDILTMVLCLLIYEAAQNSFSHGGNYTNYASIISTPPKV